MIFTCYTPRCWSRQICLLMRIHLGKTMKEARVLLADSHVLMLEGLNYLLKPTFEVVGMVSDTNSLLEAADKLKPDVAVADLSMPTFHEVNAVHQLKDRNPELKVIVLSVHDEPTVVQETLASGVSGFVLLRSAAWDLMPAIQKVLQGKTYVSPAVDLR